MLQHYILSNEDIIFLHQRNKSQNRLGFALQLCALRHPGRYIAKGEAVPEHLINFVAAQIGLKCDDILDYAKRIPTRYEHLRVLQTHYGFRQFQHCKAEMQHWLIQTAIETRNNAELAELFVSECRNRKIILPGMTVIERLCADARVAAERHIVDLIASRLDEHMKQYLQAMLNETVDGRLTVHAWLKRFEAGHNSADVNRLLDKLEYLQELNIPESLLDGIPAHRVIWLRQQGEAYYADGLRDIKENRRFAILAACAIEWKALITDAVLETHDRIVGKLYSDCKRKCDEQFSDQKKLANETLTSFVTLGKKLDMLR